MSKRRSPDAREPAIGDPVADGWRWLRTLPRAPVPHPARGEDPQAIVRALLAELGDPHYSLRAIHIAGSKGKGSTALYIEALLQALGQRTFTYTSPHLERWTERFRLDGAEADQADTLASLEAVREAAQRLDVKPGFFETLTVAGFHLAARSHVDWCIIEAGVGGRADATNVIRPAASVITSVEREHVDRLGDTLAAIAREKAGIIKPGAPVIAGSLPAMAEAEVTAAARQAEVSITRVGPAPGPEDGKSVEWQLSGDRLRVALPAGMLQCRLAMPAASVAYNAALALATVSRLGMTALENVQRAARVLAKQQLPGRMELVASVPPIVIDGAHTAASARALAEAVRALAPERVHLVLSLSAGKDVDAVCDPLVPLAERTIITCADPDWSLPADTLCAAIRARHPEAALVVRPKPEAAIAEAGTGALPGTLVVATGSVYLAGCVRGLFGVARASSRPLPEPRFEALRKPFSGHA